MSEAEDGPETGASPPWHRNPWVVSALLGVFFVPAIRPFLRQVPEAPPVIAQLPDYRAQLPSGADFGSADLKGEVYILGVGSRSCRRRCTEIVRASHSLAQKISAWGWDLWVVNVLLDGEGGGWSRPPETRDWQWRVLHAREDQLRPLVEDVLLPVLGATKPGAAALSSAEPPWLAELAHRGQLFLVDGSGALRGTYAIDESGLDEVYHRAQHVHRDHLLAQRRGQSP